MALRFAWNDQENEPRYTNDSKNDALDMSVVAPAMSRGESSRKARGAFSRNSRGGVSNESRVSRDFYIVAVAENRSREVGVAAINVALPHEVILSHISVKKGAGWPIDSSLM